ncbi:hypothetical protein ACUOA5_50665, partial [Escherichia coli]
FFGIKEQVITANNANSNRNKTDRCCTRLVAGQVDWIAEPLAFIQPGEILPCCCRAKGDIEIEM